VQFEALPDKDNNKDVGMIGLFAASCSTCQFGLEHYLQFKDRILVLEIL